MICKATFGTVLLAMAACIFGCTPRAEMRDYQAPKLRGVSGDVSEDSIEQFLGQWNEVDPEDNDRMLAAVVPIGEIAWFFKMTGPNTVVADEAETFVTFLRSVHFRGSPPRPSWELPEGWKESGGNGIRYATITLGTGDSSVELTVIPLPTPDIHDNAYVLSNVNRWRGQLGGEPIGLGELGEQTGRLKLDGGVAILVNLAGKLSDSPMSGAPFASGLPDGHPPVPGGSTSEGTSSGGGVSGGPAVGSADSGSGSASGDSGTAVAADPPAGMSYKVPEDWKAAENDALSAAAFEVGEGDEKVRITLTPAGGDLLANVNRWRRQVQLPPVTVDELRGQIVELKIEGGKGVYVSLVGPATAKPRETILGAIIDAGGRGWFIKLRGGAEPAAGQEANFKAFLDSLKFGTDDKADEGTDSADKASAEQ
jgi:hypothetical protein